MLQLIKRIFIPGSFLFSLAFPIVLPAQSIDKNAPHRIILFIWDGLRPDSVSRTVTPNLFRFMNEGVYFSDHHSTYPTFTMMNAASFATGDFAGKTGFFGNTLWSPNTKGRDSAGKIYDFRQPVFTEDYKLLQDLAEEHLFFVDTLLELAHQKHLKTAVVGKSGPAFLQDYRSGGIIFDEKHAYPLSLVKRLQRLGIPLPQYTYLAYPKSEQKGISHQQNPTLALPIHFLADGVTPDPTNQSGSPYSRANEYMMRVYLQQILPHNAPWISVIWMRNPDTTEHEYGPGTSNYLAALRSNDKMLGKLQQTLRRLHLDQVTNIVIVSDHAHSHISGPLALFPLREIRDGQVREINARGYSVSGEIRLADLLHHAGFKAFDGLGCQYNPITSGILKDGNRLFAKKIDRTGKICGKKNTLYTTPSYLVPKVLSNNAIIVAANGGSDYVYVPSHQPKLVRALVRFFQSHQEFGVIFIDGLRYSPIKGTLPMSLVHIDNPEHRSPDIIVGFNFNNKAIINGLPGIEYSDSINLRGMHGSFSHIDVHNFMAANGPDFKHQFKDRFPSANVDVAPTLAHLLKLSLKNTDGRVLREALVQKQQPILSVKAITYSSPIVTNLTVYNALGQTVNKHSYQSFLYCKKLHTNAGDFLYFDQAEAKRH